MAAYRQVYDSHQLQADCQEPGSAPEPYARLGSRVWASFTFFCTEKSTISHCVTLQRGRTRTYLGLPGWRRGIVVSGVRRMNEVNARRARLVPGWVTVFGPVYHLGM